MVRLQLLQHDSLGANVATSSRPEGKERPAPSRTVKVHSSLVRVVLVVLAPEGEGTAHLATQCNHDLVIKRAGLVKVNEQGLATEGVSGPGLVENGSNGSAAGVFIVEAQRMGQ